MTTKIEYSICDGQMFKWLMAAGLAWLERNQERVNQLNVFPVPDGDTGTNMYLTMRKAYDEVAKMEDKHVGDVSAALARGALLGARGNSGVILSQIFRGFARALEQHEAFDAQLFAIACKSSIEMAYKAVVNPVEGTILTVSRRAMEAAIKQSETETNLRLLLETMVSAGHDALLETPQLLPILAKAGVVDSGGQGFVFIIEGMLRMLRGEDVYVQIDELPEGRDWQAALVPQDDEGYGYDVQFLIQGENLNVDKVRADIDAMGWSTLVVGDDKLIKVHVHVHNPGEPLNYVINMGAALDDVVVENMQQQYEHYVEERLARETGEYEQVDGVAVIAVASGEGLAQVFRNELQVARVVTGGQTMNPSTEDFLSAIDSLPNKKIILLPNNGNIIMAARQAASLAPDRQIRVVPTRNLPSGIGALFAYINMINIIDIDEIAEAMRETAQTITSLEVTTATRDVELDGVNVKKGQYIGLLNDTLVTAGDDILTVVRELLHKSHADERELITLYFGEGQDQTAASTLVDALTEEFADQEFEIVRGGQPLYPYIISVE